MNKIGQELCKCGHPKYTHNVFNGECEVRKCHCKAFTQPQEPQKVEKHYCSVCQRETSFDRGYCLEHPNKSGGVGNPESLASTEMLLDSDKRCDIQDEFFKRYNKLPSPEIQSDITNLIFLVAEQQLTQCQSIIAKKYESEINKLRAQITELTK